MQMGALGYGLQPRGHIILLGLADVESCAAANFSLNSTKRSPERFGKLNSISALFYTINIFRQGTKVVLQ